jgi:hypothetical protein
MALADWEVHAANALVTLDTINTITGTSSLRIAGNSGFAVGYANILPSKASLHPHGFTRGALRALFKPVGLGSGRQIGLSCMQSDRNITTTGTVFYSAEATGTALVLNKGTSSIQSSRTQLATTSYTMVVGTVFALELQWDLLLDELNGIDLVVRLGTLTDFSDLTQVLHYIDTSSPLQISRGEGILYSTLSVQSINIEFRVDETTLYRIL